MRVNKRIGCQSFPCDDVRHECFIVPYIDVNPESISVIMISEAAPPALDNYYYAGGNFLFQLTTVQAFNDAGVK